MALGIAITSTRKGISSQSRLAMVIAHWQLIADRREAYACRRLPSIRHHLQTRSMAYLKSTDRSPGVRKGPQDYNVYSTLQSSRIIEGQKTWDYAGFVSRPVLHCSFRAACRKHAMHSRIRLTQLVAWIKTMRPILKVLTTSFRMIAEGDGDRRSSGSQCRAIPLTN
jgi:hypothetical protein